VVRVPVSRDGEALLLLCSWLGLPKGVEGDGPLSQQEWNALALKIAQSPLERPGALLGLDTSLLTDALEVQQSFGDRMHRLLSRAGPLAIELERLSSLGIWATTRADDSYPARLKEVLGAKAPSCLFGAGDPDLLARDALAIVGSRDLDQPAAEFAERLGMQCVSAGFAVVSGGAKGADRFGMAGALDAGGYAMGVLAESLEKTIAGREVRQWIMAEQLTLVTPFHPRAGFTVGTAMQRNKLVYGLAQYAIVVASDKDTGGTWAGAVENLKAGWAPLFVRTGPTVPPGNHALLKRGAIPFPDTDECRDWDMRDWLEELKARGSTIHESQALQGQLFGS